MAIDIDVNDRTRTPCQTPGCSHPNFHVCMVGKDHLFPVGLVASYQSRAARRSWESGNRKPLSERSPEVREAISEGQKKRWNTRNSERDQKMVERYAEGNISMDGLGLEFGVGRFVVRRVLARAEEAGIITKNPIGRTLTQTDGSDERAERLVERYAKGNIGLDALSRMFHMRRTTALEILRKAADEGRIELRTKGATIAKQGTADRDKKMIERYSEGGLNMEELANEFGVKRDTVRRLVIQALEEGKIIIKMPA